MGKRKGKVELSLTASNLKGKRVRENGRLKLQENASNFEELQDQLLKEAGVDEEMMESIPETEKQAIIKAILESKPQLKDPSLCDENEEETQPPDDFVSCETPSPQNPDNQMETNLDKTIEDELSSEKSSTDVSQGHKSPVNSSTSTVELEKDAGNFPCDEDLTQNYQLEQPPVVLATETQFSPQHKKHQDHLDDVPESPASSLGQQEIDGHVLECDETEIKFLKRSKIYGHVSSTQQFPPRYSPESIKDPAVYSQVIKLMFDIYNRRLHSVQKSLKSKPLQWGKPVRKGMHCENLLRRKVSEHENEEGETKAGRGKRLMRRRQLKENCNTDTSPDESYKRSKKPSTASGRLSNKSLCPTVIDDETDIVDVVNRTDFDNEFSHRYTKSRTTFSDLEKSGIGVGKIGKYRRRKELEENSKSDVTATNQIEDDSKKTNPHGTVTTKGPKKLSKVCLDEPVSAALLINNFGEKSSPLATGSDLDQENLDNGAGIKRKNTSYLVSEKDVSSIKSKRKIRNNDPDYPVQNPSHTDLFARKQQFEKEKNPQTSDVEIVGDDNDSRGANALWLSSEKGRERKVPTGKRKQCKTRTDMPRKSDSPNVKECGKSILKGRGEKIDAKQGTLSKIFISEDISVIDEGSNSSSLPDISYQKEVGEFHKDDGDKSEAEKLEDKQEKLSIKGGEIDDIPNSLESGPLLNSQGDMYSTQFDSKLRKAIRKIKTTGGEMPDTQIPSTSSFVAISGSLESRKRKKNAVGVEEFDNAVSSRNDDRSKRMRGKKRESLNSGEHESEDNNFTSSTRLEVELNVTDKDDTILSEAKKGTTLDQISTSKQKSSGKNKSLNKKKKKLFDVDSYDYAGEENTFLSLDVNREKEREKMDEEEIFNNVGISTDVTRTDPQTDINDLHMEKSDEGTCPICGKNFMLKDLETHASTCGEGDPIVTDHTAQNSSVAQGSSVKMKTRTRKTGRRKGLFLTNEKSPSSSGEDYGELIVE